MKILFKTLTIFPLKIGFYLIECLLFMMPINLLQLLSSFQVTKKNLTIAFSSLFEMKHEKMQSPNETNESKKEFSRIVALKIEATIDNHIDQYPQLKHDRELLESIPGVGVVVSRTMLAVIHSRSFKKASEVAAFLGVIPKICESGKISQELLTFLK